MRGVEHYLCPARVALRRAGRRLVALVGSNSVLGIANEFLERASEQGASVTPMQLQKLCYLAHGFSLALFGKPLVADKLEAWDWGPVFPTLYDAIKHYGSRPIPEPICVNNWASHPTMRGSVVKADISPSESRLIDTVWKDYGKFEAFQLSALTHEPGSPWEEVYKPGKMNIRISNDRIRDYFAHVVQ